MPDTVGCAGHMVKWSRTAHRLSANCFEQSKQVWSPPQRDLIYIEGRHAKSAPERKRINRIQHPGNNAGPVTAQ